MILLDATPLDGAHRDRGVGRFVLELVRALEAHPGIDDLDLRLLRLPGEAPACSRFPEWRPPRPFARSGRVALRTAGLWWSLRSCPPGTVFHGTDPVALARPARGRLLATCHDIIPLLFPDRYLSWRHDAGTLRATYRWWLPRTLRRADAIATVSDEVGRTLESVLGLPRSRMRTIHHGGPEAATFASDAAAEARAAEIAGGTPFVLAVGAADWRKDLETAVRAVGRLGARGVPIRLLHAGRLWDGEAASLRETAHACGAMIEFTGYVSDALLGALYRRAVAFVFPSRAEGFGLPLLEAMAADCPVVACETSCLPEIAGDAALWHAPDDDAGLAGCLQRLIAEPDLQEALRERGRERLGRFRWDRAASAYVDLYRRLASA